MKIFSGSEDCRSKAGKIKVSFSSSWPIRRLLQLACLTWFLRRPMTISDLH